MLPSDSRPGRPSDRPGRRKGRVAVEGLETRQLMAYSVFGYSLPELAVTGYAAPEASWGGPLSIDVRVDNYGASSLVEPTHQAPGSPTNADSGPTTVQIFASAKPGVTTGLVPIDVVQIPTVLQNSQYETVSTIALPSRPAGFPGSGGKIYLTFVVNNDQSIAQITNQFNVYHDPTPVTIADALPDLQVVGFDVPSPLQPGDVITPTVRIANFGAGNPASQGPVLVQIVASLNTTYGPGDAVIGQYMITSLPGISGVPTQGSIANDANVIITPNENDYTLGPIQLPTTPGVYHIGVKIDPYHTINQTYAPNAALSFPVTVGPPSLYQTPATVINTSSGIPVFPALPYSDLTEVPTPTATTTPVIAPIFQATPVAQGSTVSAFAVSGYPIVAKAKNSKLHLVQPASTAKTAHPAAHAAHKAAHKVK